jgi:hypothetical protein
MHLLGNVSKDVINVFSTFFHIFKFLTSLFVFVQDIVKFWGKEIHTKLRQD